jgi:hypothetical protein
MMIHAERMRVVCLSPFRRIIMSQSTISCDTQFSPHASLAALVAHLKARGIFDDLCTHVQIAQKTV